MTDYHSDNIDANEIAKFEAQVDMWWDQRGAFKALHEINPVRLAYIRQRCGLIGKRVLDVGCGGGLLAEAMAAEGAHVTGIDMVAGALEVAKTHADQNGYVAYPNIKPLEEMANFMAATRSYEANVRAFEAVKELVRRSLELGS